MEGVRVDQSNTYFFWLHYQACGIFVPPPGIEPGPLAVKTPSPNHWTAREFQHLFKYLKSVLAKQQARKCALISKHQKICIFHL